MAYKDVLPQTNLEAIDIRDTLGCPSNNLADYCTKAKTGGIGSYAFTIVENGHTPSDGYLINNTVPYFNIYSNNTPAEWVVDGLTNAVCRLKRNIYGDITSNGRAFNASSYCFDLGAFRGYVHKAKAPHPFSLSASAIPMDSGQYQITLGFFVPGDYNWSNLAPNIPTNELYYSIESSNTNIRIPHNDTTMTPFNEAADHFGIAVQWIGNYPPSTINVKLGLYRKRDSNNYLPIAYIPMESTATGNTGGSIEIEAPTIVQPTPKPMAVVSMVIDPLIGHPHMTMLHGYTVGDPENSRSGSSLNYRIRWKPDEPIERTHNLSGYVYHKGITCQATVGMATAPSISRAEAEESGGAFNQGDPTWYFTGAVDVTEIQYLIPRPESLHLNVRDVVYDGES